MAIDRQTQSTDIAARNLRQRVDRGRNGLRLAGNIGDEGDRRAEFAERLGEGENGADDDAPARRAAD